MRPSGGLAPGAYVLLAKVNQSANTKTDGRCRIQAEGDYDDSNRGLREEGTPEGHNLQLIHTFAGSGTAVLACRSRAGVWSAADAKLIAIRVSASTTNVVSATIRDPHMRALVTGATGFVGSRLAARLVERRARGPLPGARPAPRG